MNIDNLTSGLIGAAIGLVGAVVIQWNESRMDLRASARAVFLEVAANTRALELAAEHGVYAPLATTTWAAAHHRLSRGLSPEDLVIVARLYMDIEAIKGGDYPTGGPPILRLQPIAQLALAQSALAAKVLEDRGWRPWQRRAPRALIKSLSLRD